MSGPSALESVLIDRIAKQGPMPFAAFMQIALYHPHLGYYAQPGPRTGWSGHFVTSPELDPAFGELWARGFHEIWSACGSPDRFGITEIGPGEGGFAEAVLGAASGDFARALSYRLVERNPDAAQRQRARLEPIANVSWSESIVDIPRAEAGIVFANEVLDNLPVHLVHNVHGEIREVCVSAADGALTFESLPLSSPELERFLQRTGTVLPDGHRTEIPLAAESFVARAAAAVSLGAVLFVDYGDEAPALADRPGGSLVCYSPEGADDDPLADPGGKDITSHANWTAVRTAGMRAGLDMAGPRPQRDVLIALGSKELDRALQEDHRAAIAVGRGADAVRSLSRRQAIGALVDEGGLGALGVVAGTAGIPIPRFLR
jgi:SAM-dependent MidA family methyltransferase